MIDIIKKIFYIYYAERAVCKAVKNEIINQTSINDL